MGRMDELLEWAQRRKHVPLWLVAGGVLLVIISGCIWWHYVYEDPYNVYWGMISNSLSTSAVTKHVTEETSGGTLNQYTTLNFGVPNIAFGKTTLHNASSTVTTESFGTLANDYVRYTQIKTTDMGKSGQGLDFSPVLGKWAKASANSSASGGQSNSAPYFIQSLLGFYGGNLVPIANLPADSRSSLINFLQQNIVFDPDFSTVREDMVHGRPMYTYTVSIEPVAYVAFQRAFASDLGIKSLANVDPNNYEDQPAIKVDLVVDARSHRLSRVVYPGTKHTETFTSYGVPVQVSPPKKTITAEKLQQLLTGVQ